MNRNSATRWVSFGGTTMLLLAVGAEALGASAIDQANPIGGVANARNVTSINHYAQTFTAGRSGLLTRIDVDLFKDTSASGDVIVELRAVDSSGIPGTTPTDVLYQTNVNATSFANSSTYNVSVDVSGAGILMNQGDRAAISLRRTTTSTAIKWWVIGPTYGPGQAFTRSSLTSLWSPLASNDATFRTWADNDILSASRSFSPIFDATAEFNGSTFTLSSSDYAIGVDRSTSFNSERRGILEFPIYTLPSNAIIHSASLQLTTAVLVESDTISPSISIHGYAANGQLDFADATVPLNLIGQSGPIKDTTALISVPLDPAYIQSLLGNSNYLGLSARADVEDYGVQFWSSEYPSASFRPQLLINYEIPAVNNGDYNANGRVDAADYVMWRSTLAQTVSPRHGADGTGDAYIDDADYDFWRNRFGNVAGSGSQMSLGASAGTVPEPGPAWLVLVASVSAMSIRAGRYKC